MIRQDFHPPLRIRAVTVFMLVSFGVASKAVLITCSSTIPHKACMFWAKQTASIFSTCKLLFQDMELVKSA